MEDEALHLYSRIRHFKHEEGAYIEWNRREKEIATIQNDCTFDRMRNFYKNLFAPSPEAKYASPLQRYSTIKERRDSDLEDLKLYRAAKSLPKQEKNSLA